MSPVEDAVKTFPIYLCPTLQTSKCVNEKAGVGLSQVLLRRATRREAMACTLSQITSLDRHTNSTRRRTNAKNGALTTAPAIEAARRMAYGNEGKGEYVYVKRGSKATRRLHKNEGKT